MQTIATRLSRREAGRVDRLVKTGLYVSRSEVLRDALRRLLETERTRRLRLRETVDLDRG